MSHRTVTYLIALWIVAAPAVSAAEPVALETNEHKTLYTLGQALAQGLAVFQLTSDELAIVEAGLGDAILGRPARVDLREFQAEINNLARARHALAGERESALGKVFVDKMAEAAGAVRLDSGLVYIELAAGDGPSPTRSDTVRLHYRGSLRDGQVFDQSDPSDPATFNLAAVVPCFGEGVTRMKVGGKAKLVCAAELAYGEQGFPPRILPGAALAFEIELVEILAPSPEPASPATPAQPD